MRHFFVIVNIVFGMTLVANGQTGVETEINRRIQPPLQRQSISEQLVVLEKQLAEATKEVDFWRNARFYNDKKKERMRKEKLVYWAQRTVDIRNQMTELKKDRKYYQHKTHGNQRYYYDP